MRSQSLYDQRFLTKDGEPIGEHGVRKLVVKYRNKAGITKEASYCSIRHTFAALQAEKRACPFQLKRCPGIPT